MKEKWMSRKLFGYVLALLALVLLAKLTASGEAYTALGLIGVAYLGGQAAVDTWSKK